MLLMWAGNWWALGLRAAAAILLGIIALFWPAIGALALAIRVRQWTLLHPPITEARG